MFNIIALLDIDSIFSCLWITAWHKVREVRWHQTADGFEVFDLVQKAQVNQEWCTHCRRLFLRSGWHFNAAFCSFWFAFIVNKETILQQRKLVIQVNITVSVRISHKPWFMCLPDKITLPHCLMQSRWRMIFSISYLRTNTDRIV